jgi:hypothetical protein
MSDGYFLRVNGHWVPIPNVQSGVQVTSERAVSSFTSVAGVPHSQASRRAPRTWNVDLGSQVGPEAVSALMVAAEGDGGDVLLWDEAAARANALDPLSAIAPANYPGVLCGTVPLRSLTRGTGGSANLIKTELSTAHAIIRPSGVTGRGVFMAAQVDSLLRFQIPPTPEGMALTSAELRLFGPSGSPIDVYATVGGWVEPPTSAATTSNYWETATTGTLLGSGARTTPLGGWSIQLSGVSAYVNSVLNLRLKVDSGSADPVDRIGNTGTPPSLVLRYVTLGGPSVFRQYLREGDYRITVWTDAAEGVEFGSWTADVGAGPITGPLYATAGTGWRRISLPITLTFPVEVTFTINDSAAYRIAGLMVTSTLAEVTNYRAPHKTPVPVYVEDPTLTLDSLYDGEQGMGQRSVVIREDG